MDLLVRPEAHPTLLVHGLFQRPILAVLAPTLFELRCEALNVGPATLPCVLVRLPLLFQLVVGLVVLNGVLAVVVGLPRLGEIRLLRLLEFFTRRWCWSWRLTGLPLLRRCPLGDLFCPCLHLLARFASSASFLLFIFFATVALLGALSLVQLDFHLICFFLGVQRLSVRRVDGGVGGGLLAKLVDLVISQELRLGLTIDNLTARNHIDIVVDLLYLNYFTYVSHRVLARPVSVQF